MLCVPDIHTYTYTQLQKIHTQLQNIHLNLSNRHLKSLVEVASAIPQAIITVNHSSTKWMFPKISSWLVLNQFNQCPLVEQLVGAAVNSSKALMSCCGASCIT